MRSLFFPEMYHRPEEIHNATKSTCNWLFEHNHYQQWLQQHGLLWIKGKPGAGKSTLIRHAVELEDQGCELSPQKLLVVSFFFHGRGTELQRNPLGMFRSLLHQLLKRVPELQARFNAIYQTKCKYERPFQWSVRALRDFFEVQIVDLAKYRHVRLYIDALDEAGEETAIDLVEYFRQVVTNASSSSPLSSLSVCFSCRHFPAISIEEGLEICVERENSRDIAIYLAHRLGQIRNLSLMGSLRDQLLDNSSGSFQWVVLVTSVVLNLYRKGKAKEILKSVPRIPSELASLYEQLLSENDEKDRPLSLRLMRWVYYAAVPLTLQELNWAMVLDTDVSYKSLESCREADEFTEDDEDMGRRVIDLSRGLVEIRNAFHVQFIHQSVYDYFEDTGFRVLGLHPQASSTDPNIYANYRLAKACLYYMTLSESNSNTDVDWRKGLSRGHGCGFLYYATYYWTHHAQRADSVQVLLGEVFNKICTSFTDPLPYWIAQLGPPKGKFDLGNPYYYFRLIDAGDSKMTLLHVAATFDTPHLLAFIISHEDTDINARTNSGKTPLMYAAAFGNHLAVSTLIGKEGLDANARDHGGRTALSYAAETGEIKVVKAVLSNQLIEKDFQHNKTTGPVEEDLLRAQLPAVNTWLSHHGLQLFPKRSGKSSLPLPFY